MVQIGQIGQFSKLPVVPVVWIFLKLKILKYPANGRFQIFQFELVIGSVILLFNFSNTRVVLKLKFALTVYDTW